MTQETLREAVARAIATSDGLPTHAPLGYYLVNADAAIATMFERLRTPSDAVLEAGMDYDERVLQIHLGRPPTVEECQLGQWQAMLAAFQQENSDAD